MPATNSIPLKGYVANHRDIRNGQCTMSCINIIIIVVQYPASGHAGNLPSLLFSKATCHVLDRSLCRSAGGERSNNEKVFSLMSTWTQQTKKSALSNQRQGTDRQTWALLKSFFFIFLAVVFLCVWNGGKRDEQEECVCVWVSGAGSYFFLYYSTQGLDKTCTCVSDTRHRLISLHLK